MPHVTECLARHRWHQGRAHVFEVRRRYKNHAADFAKSLPWSWSIGPIISNDLPVEPSRLNLAFMTVSLVTACFALLAAVLHFVSYKRKRRRPSEKRSTAKTPPEAPDPRAPALETPAPLRSNHLPKVRPTPHLKTGQTPSAATACTGLPLVI